jgi:hypothetical protein
MLLLLKTCIYKLAQPVDERPDSFMTLWAAVVKNKWTEALPFSTLSSDASGPMREYP